MQKINNRGMSLLRLVLFLGSVASQSCFRRVVPSSTVLMHLFLKKTPLLIIRVNLSGTIL